MAASGGHLLIQQSPLVEGRIKTLVNNDLRMICRAYGQIVSGTKITLQQRCITILRDIVAKGDVDRFNELSSRVSNHGVLLSTTSGSLARPSYPTPAPNNSAVPRPVYGQSPRMEFKSSPFYERLEVVLRAPDLVEMPQNRHTVKSNLILTEDQVRRLISDQDQYRLMVYCAQSGLGGYSAVDIAFPPQIEIKVNDDEVKANFKGLKNKPGSTKPADITRMVRLKTGYSNKLSICYALTLKRFVCSVYLVRYVNADALVQRIRSNRVFPKHKVLEEMNRLNADPDIAATSSKMSLKDPVSTLRITVPIRSTVCSHNQCFDASFFLQLQEQAPTWQCPICNRAVSFESLSVDKYFEEILQTTPRSIEQVAVEPNGEWRVVKDDADAALSNSAKGAPRAAYDDDFDDDELIELEADEQPAIKKEMNNNALHAFSTPPLSSREPSIAQSHNQPSNKRASAVIDLTLSDDDEDEPVRPAKRSRIDPPVSNTQQPPGSSTAGIHAPSQRSTNINLGPVPTYTSHTSVAMQSPISMSPFTANAAPGNPFTRPPDPNARPASHTGNSANSIQGQWAPFRSPSAPFNAGEEYPGPLSSSNSPNDAGNRNWLSPNSTTHPRPQTMRAQPVFGAPNFAQPRLSWQSTSAYNKDGGNNESLPPG